MIPDFHITIITINVHLREESDEKFKKWVVGREGTDVKFKDKTSHDLSWWIQSASCDPSLKGNLVSRLCDGNATQSLQTAPGGYPLANHGPSHALITQPNPGDIHTFSTSVKHYIVDERPKHNQRQKVFTYGEDGTVLQERNITPANALWRINLMGWQRPQSFLLRSCVPTATPLTKIAHWDTFAALHSRNPLSESCNLYWFLWKITGDVKIATRRILEYHLKCTRTHIPAALSSPQHPGPLASPEACQYRCRTRSTASTGSCTCPPAPLHCWKSYLLSERQSCLSYLWCSLYLWCLPRAPAKLHDRKVRKHKPNIWRFERPTPICFFQQVMFKISFSWQIHGGKHQRYAQDQLVNSNLAGNNSTCGSVALGIPKSKSWLPNIATSMESAFR